MLKCDEEIIALTYFGDDDWSSVLSELYKSNYLN